MRAVNLFFIEEAYSVNFNGIGTFGNILLSQLVRYEHIKVHLITLNAQHKELSYHTQGNITYIRTPSIGNSDWNHHAPVLVPLIRNVFQDNARNVFIVNNSPCSNLLRQIRSCYPMSKIIFVIHDQRWTAPLFGNAEHLKNIMADNRTDELETMIYQTVKDDSEIYRLSDATVCLSLSTQKILF